MPDPFRKTSDPTRGKYKKRDQNQGIITGSNTNILTLAGMFPFSARHFISWMLFYKNLDCAGSLPATAGRIKRIDLRVML